MPDVHRATAAQIDHTGLDLEAFFSSADRNLVRFRQLKEAEMTLQQGGRSFLHCYLPGQSNLPLVWFVQGLGATYKFFFEGVMLFSRMGFPVLSIARRGDYDHEEELDTESILADMQGHLETFGHQEVHLIASSLGSALAMQFAARNQGQVVSAVTIGGFYRFPWIFAHDLLFDFLKSLQIETLPVRELGPFSPQVRYIIRRSKNLVDFMLSEYEHFPLSSFMQYMQMVKTMDLEKKDNIPAVDIPLFFMHGQYDETITPACLQGMARSHPEARTLLMKDCAHGPFLSKPAEMYRSVLDFYRGL